MRISYKIILAILVVYTLVFHTLFLHANINNPNGMAVAMMTWGVVLVWIFIGGLLMYRFREVVQVIVLHIRGDWKTKFVIFATLLALLEEGVTVTMTNLAPAFGANIGEAYITASTNYFDVVVFHSVIVFIPIFIVIAFLLGKYRASPLAVFLIFGLVGTFCEIIFSGNLFVLLQAPFWIFVYGLMVYLPAYTIPENRNAIPMRLSHYLCAIPVIFILAFPIIIPLVFFITKILQHPPVHF